MRHRQNPALPALILIGQLGLWAGPFVSNSIVSNAFAQDQELEQLIEGGEEEVRELKRLETEIQGVEEDDGILGKVRLPRGEEAPQMLIRQDLPIDPDTYVVGPSDVLQLYIWGEFDIAYALLVDPEGHILIPTVGDFEVGELTLTEVRELVHEAAKQKYQAVEMTLNLESMRFFTVYITGLVTHEGGIAVHPNNRVSDVIDLAGGFIDELRGDIGEEIAGGKSVTRVRRLEGRPTARRAVLVSHQDATVDTVDLTMYLSTGEMRYNPYLRMGDRIHVNFRRDTVSLFGPFFREGQQEYRPGDTISDIIALSSGRRNENPIEYVELWRWRPKSEEYEIIPLAGAINSGADIPIEAFGDFPLEPKDQIFVRTVYQWQYGPRVTVHGEIRYNGNYRIHPGQSTLKDVIAMAGGFTDDAALELATVTSTRYATETDPELFRVQKLRQIAQLRPEEEAYLKSKAAERQGEIVVDFVRLFLEADESQNIILGGGDQIYIPKKPGIVKVTGAFEEPGLITYEPGKDLEYYMDLAGGFTRLADRDEARLIRADSGLRLRFEDDLVVEESDEIWVPMEPYRDWWDIAETSVTIVTQTLTMIVILTALNR